MTATGASAALCAAWLGARQVGLGPSNPHQICAGVMRQSARAILAPGVPLARQPALGRDPPHGRKLGRIAINNNNRAKHGANNNNECAAPVRICLGASAAT